MNILDKSLETAIDNMEKRVVQAQMDAYTRGYIDGLEAAANTVDSERDTLIDNGNTDYIVKILRNQADKLKEGK